MILFCIVLRSDDKMIELLFLIILVVWINIGWLLLNNCKLLWIWIFGLFYILDLILFYYLGEIYVFFKWWNEVGFGVWNSLRV